MVKLKFLAFAASSVRSESSSSCAQPSSWYKNLSSRVNFSCEDGTGHAKKCSVSCPENYMPSITEISCSCFRESGVPRNKCRWQPKRSLYKPRCIPTEPANARRQQRFLLSSESKPVKIPFNADFEKVVLTSWQAREKRQNGEKIPNKYVLKRPDDISKPKRIDENGLMARSNQKNSAQWKEKLVSGVYQVPFKFGSRTEFGFSDSTKQSIRDHLKWFNSEAGKCIVFKEENSEDFEGSRLKIVGAQSGCWSFIGKTHKEQLISLGSGCHTLGRSLHEFFHALGFLHEHQRPDRDSFVDVHWENIRNGHAQDFAKVAQNQFVDNFVGYDINSVMHYSEDAFSNGHGPTLTLKSSLSPLTTGQRLRPTTKDMMGVCKSYGCDATCSNDLEMCDSGGEQYFASRKCDGFADCSDGSDEVGCGSMCCKKWEFGGEVFEEQGTWAGQAWYRSSTSSKVIYLNERMGFWILGRTLGSDSAYSFGNFAPGQCANEASGWLTYEINEWTAVNYIPNCLEKINEDIFETTTFVPQTGMGIHWQVDDMLNGGNYTEDNSTDSAWWYDDDEEEKCSEYSLPYLSAGNYSCVGSDAFSNVEQDGFCFPSCEPNYELKCSSGDLLSKTARCKKVDGEVFFVHDRTEIPFGGCDCVPSGCDMSELPVSEHYNWLCKSSRGNFAPKGTLCEPECRRWHETAIPVGGDGLKCGEDGNWHGTTKVLCKSCPRPKILSQPSSGEIECNSLSGWNPMRGNQFGNGQTCRARCPAGQELSCTGKNLVKGESMGIQKCQKMQPKGKGKVSSMGWTNKQKCHCVYECDRSVYTRTLGKRVRFKRTGSKKNPVKLTLATIKRCPKNKRITNKKPVCRNGSWEDSRTKEINPPLCENI